MEARRIPDVYFPGDLEHSVSAPVVSYEILNTPEMRSKYISLTEGLVSHLLDDKTEVAIFLDKSARPVAWLVNELWDNLAPIDPETGEKPAKPQIKFLNIDREQWGATTGRSEDGTVNVNNIMEERIDELRQVLAPVVGVSKPGDKSLLTDKRVSVVDEVRMSGDTLLMAEKILRRAFTDAKDIDGYYWMLEPAHRDPKSGMLLGGEVPVWYRDDTNHGRLVAGRDTTKSSHSNSSRQRIGGYWLSTNFRNGPDVPGRQLKAEVKQLAKDFKEHKIPYVFSPLWNTKLEKLEDRIPRLGGISVEQYAQLKKNYPVRADFVDHYPEAVNK